MSLEKLEQHEADPAATAPQTFTLADLDRPEIDWVLELMNFQTGPVAHQLRAGGEEIPRKIEKEQAHVLRWLLKLALVHGKDWPKYADARTHEIHQRLKKPPTDA